MGKTIRFLVLLLALNSTFATATEFELRFHDQGPYRIAKRDVRRHGGMGGGSKETGPDRSRPGNRNYP